ncbi:Peroxisomal NUDIX hydrolase [Phaffia rhodozyma]|uniref:Peroxisomal NUDIX hydrolase n=1 Tax=Phaffia rhodozyma TaxID=264483 RepID=A0A0F7SRN5_PHARH|nr:Peroxisomal NUDIX hydrolase [Phaffia rhodozyma]
MTVPESEPTQRKKHEGVPSEALAALSEKARECILNVEKYPSWVPGRSFGKVKRAAVLVILYERKSQPGLRVLMTTRSQQLRSHPGQSALPGGKVDSEDTSVEHTARREAYEETNFPLDPTHSTIFPLTTLEPFLSKYNLIVHPHVVFVSDESTIDHLEASPDEVDRIWELPLESVLDLAFWGNQTEEARSKLSVKGEEDWLYEEDVYSTSDIPWLNDTIYRMHRFRTTETPIKGLSSDILIETAVIAFGREPSYDRFPSLQTRATWNVAIDKVVEESLEKGWDERRKLRESLPQR